ncbi:tetratricopeptide repeat protein [Spiribacter vilamensis]|nr:tetratricopeptide repeat protein [Spiribacter vilamensis]
MHRPARLALIVPMLLLQGCLALTPNGPPSVIETLAAADSALERGDIEQARMGYERALEQSPALVSPHFQLGIIAYGRGDDPAALEHFDAALERDPGHVLATYNLAVVHLQQARSLLDRHERLAPISAGRPDLIRIRQAIGALGRSAAGTRE